MNLVGKKEIGIRTTVGVVTNINMNSINLNYANSGFLSPWNSYWSECRRFLSMMLVVHISQPNRLTDDKKNTIILEINI